MRNGGGEMRVLLSIAVAFVLFTSVMLFLQEHQKQNQLAFEELKEDLYASGWTEDETEALIKGMGTIVGREMVFREWCQQRPKFKMVSYGGDITDSLVTKKCPIPHAILMLCPDPVKVDMFSCLPPRAEAPELWNHFIKLGKQQIRQ